MCIQKSMLKELLDNFQKKNILKAIYMLSERIKSFLFDYCILQALSLIKNIDFFCKLCDKNTRETIME